MDHTKTTELQQILVSIREKDIVQLIFDYYVKHKVTWRAIEDIAKIINAIIEKKVVCDSKYLFLKMIGNKLIPSFHLACCSCEKFICTYNKKRSRTSFIKCTSCFVSNNIANCKVIFVTFPIKQMLQQVLGIYKNVLEFGMNAEAFPINDVFNGYIHRSTMEKEKKPFISITFNTDGLRLFNATKNAMWPILIYINNLPKHLRFLPDNILVYSLYHNQHIDMDNYVKVFVNEINEINEELGGILVNGISYKIFCLYTCLDAPAKAKVSCQKNHSGYSSCNYCYIDGSRVAGAVKFKNE